MDPITLGLLALGALGAGTLISACGGNFHYKQKNGSWRAYFKGTPSSMSHVLHDSDGYYVCWDRPIRSEDEAQHVAQQWMDRYG